MNYANVTLTKDVRKLWSLLPEISRTFAFTIPKLPKDTARDLAVNYAVCRVIDTIEDSTLESDHKSTLMDSFLNLLKAKPAQKTIHMVTAQLQKVPTISHGYRKLLDSVGSLNSVFKALNPAAQRTVIRLSTEMAKGFSDISVQNIETMEDQNLYCHYAAGIVGYMITEHFMHCGYISAQKADNIKELSHDFGLALQKINIIKDVAEDVQDKRHYWPRKILAEKGLTYADLVNPNSRKKLESAMEVLQYLINDAHVYIERSLKYIEELPFDPPGLKIFCADNLLMGVATLRHSQTTDIFDPDKKVKISRDEVYTIDRHVTDIVLSRKSVNEFAEFLKTSSALEFKID